MESPQIRIAPTDSTGEEARYGLGEYFKEIDERFEGGFEDDHSAVPEDLKPPDGLFLLVTVDGRPLGCGALKRADDEVGDLKRMWMDPSARGLGVGRRRLEALESHALELGLKRVRLAANRVSPFNDIQYADHRFEKRL